MPYEANTQMTVTKKQKLNKKKTLILNAFTNGSAMNWTHPDDRSAELGHSIDAWIEYAKLAERGKLNSLFIADHLALFDTWNGPNNFKEPARLGVNIARIEPGSIISALATHTKTIGFGVTFSTVSEHPYLFAKRVATLDNLSKGRLGWNIVSSYLPGVGRQLLDGKLPDHDERYDKTQEYLDVVYDLLLSSWRDDALVQDKQRQVFVDPERIREVNHKGKYFNVPGPAITQPSPQRIPVILQAGTSSKGKLFAAENAEIVFVDAHDPTKVGKSISEIKKLAKERFKRDPNNIKFVVPANFIIGKTHEEAIAKLAEYEKYKRPEYPEVVFSAVSGIDLSKFEPDDIVKSTDKSSGIHSITESALNKNQKQNTKKEVLKGADQNGFFGKPFVGSVIEVVDEIERWIDEYDVDGFNFGLGGIWPSNIIDVVDLLVPELQKRGLFWKDYPVPGGTFRENVFGVKGQTFLTEDHPAYGLRWQADVPLEEFERNLRLHNENRTKIRELSTDRSV